MSVRSHFHDGFSAARFTGGLAIFALCMCAVFGVRAGAAPAKLEKVVLVMRHGVRAPTKSTKWLSHYSKTPWYAWPVAPGILTRHGADGAKAMGAKLKAFYANAGLLYENPCANRRKVYVWADSEDSRTRMSGDAVSRGLLGACAVPAHFRAPAGSADPVFSHEGNKACQLDPTQAEESLLQPPYADLSHLGPEYDKARLAMVNILWPGLKESDCQGENAPKACIFLNGKNRFVPDAWKIQIEGPLKTGSSLSEDLLLEYAERHPKSAIGWGRADTAQKIRDIMPLHNIYTGLTRKNLYYASRRAAVLTREISGLMNGEASAFPGAPPVPGDARFVLFLGHDSNLSNLAGVFGLDWKLPDQPDDTAPDTALAFERWRTDDGKTFVTVRIFYLTLDELRTGGTLPRGHAMKLQIPACSGEKNGVCSVKKFAGFALSRIHTGCFAQ